MHYGNHLYENKKCKYKHVTACDKWFYRPCKREARQLDYVKLKINKSLDCQW